MQTKQRLDVNVEGLRRLLADFHNVTGQRSGVFDAEHRLILEHPEPHTPFCRVIRRSETGTRRCFACDTDGMKQALRAGRAVVYRCHAGLIEVCAPVIDDGRVLGYLTFGQVLADREADAQWEQVKAGCARYFADVGELYRAFRDVRRVTPEYLESAGRLLTAIVGYIRLEHMMRAQPGGLWGQMLRFMDGAVERPFALEDMAREMNVSVSTLCQTAKSRTGKTVGQLMLERRLRRAKTLLAETALTITEIAVQCGIADYNYFSRLFRRETGFTPSDWRQQGNDKADSSPSSSL